MTQRRRDAEGFQRKFVEAISAKNFSNGDGRFTMIRAGQAFSTFHGDWLSLPCPIRFWLIFAERGAMRARRLRRIEQG